MVFIVLFWSCRYTLGQCSREYSPAIGIYSKSQTVLARYQWTDNKSYKDQSYKGPGPNRSSIEDQEENEADDSVVASNRLE